MLVLEGAGRLGKTTAAHKLVGLCSVGARYAHMSRPNSQFNFGSDYFPMVQGSYVRDRFHLGAWAWHSREETQLDPYKMKIITAKIRAVGGLIVIFHARDIKWYTRHWIQAETRDEDITKNIQAQLNANRIFCEIVDKHSDLYDEQIEIKPDAFVSDIILLEWVLKWEARRRFANAAPSYT